MIINSRELVVDGKRCSVLSVALLGENLMQCHVGCPACYNILHAGTIVSPCHSSGGNIRGGNAIQCVSSVDFMLTARTP